MNLFRKLAADTRGIAGVELALVLGLITLAMVGAVSKLGVAESYEGTAQKVATATR